jgi:ribosomal protein L44E
MLVKGIPELKPIAKDEKRTDRQYFCVGCGDAATQTAFFKIEGAVIVERYCDTCSSKLNESMSGI